MTLEESIGEGSMPLTEVGCWIWLRKSRPPIRSLWRFKLGRKVPSGCVSHLCGQEYCINPDHMSVDLTKISEAG